MTVLPGERVDLQILSWTSLHFQFQNVPSFLHLFFLQDCQTELTQGMTWHGTHSPLRSHCSWRQVCWTKLKTCYIIKQSCMNILEVFISSFRNKNKTPITLCELKQQQCNWVNLSVSEHEHLKDISCANHIKWRQIPSLHLSTLIVSTGVMLPATGLDLQIQQTVLKWT